MIEKAKLKDILVEFGEAFSDTPRLTHVSGHEINTISDAPVDSKPYRYHKVKHEIIDYHIHKLLA